RHTRLQGDWSSDVCLPILQKWLQTHPQASVQEIELILDERLNRLRTQIMRDVALAIAKVKGFEMASKEQPRCHNCGIILTSLEKIGRASCRERVCEEGGRG